MRTPGEHQEGKPLPAGLSEHAILQQLEKLLTSRHFVHSHRHCRFLRYVVESAIAGRSKEIKEYVLAVEVFDRGTSFDPRIDPIVRVEAARLRVKLKRYYQAEGKTDDLQIQLHKGSYVPSFRLRRDPEDSRPALSRRIAVLPFSNLSPERDQDFFCEGIVEELINALTKLPDLQVVSWASVRQFLDMGMDIPSIAAQLSVSALLRGSVRKAGDLIRICVQFVNAGDGRYLWSEIYETAIGTVFEVQEEIARAIAAALKLELGRQPDWRRNVRHSKDPETVTAYLKGRYHLNRRTQDALHKAVQHFERAIAGQGQYALARAGLSEALALMAWYGFSSAGEVMPRARAEALRALEADPSLAEGHLSLALVHELYDWQWSAAGKEFDVALRLNPGAAVLLFEFGLFLCRAGKTGEGLDYLRRALELDPLSPVINTNIGVVCYYQRDHECATEHFLEALELDATYYPAHYRLGLAYMQRNYYDLALSSFGTALELSPKSTLVAVAAGCCQVGMGDPDRAEEILRQLESDRDQRYVSPLGLAVLYSVLGRSASACVCLQSAIDQRDPVLMDVRIDPLFNSLRDEPWFCGVCQPQAPFLTAPAGADAPGN